MSDPYIDFVSTPFGRTVASRLGLPRPVTLRRHTGPDTPLVTGPVLVLSDDASRADADVLAAALLPWDLDVRRDPHLAEGQTWGAAILVLTGVATPGDLAPAVLTLGGTLRRLARCGRIVTVSRTATPDLDPATAAARQGVDGFLR